MKNYVLAVSEEESGTRIEIHYPDLDHLHNGLRSLDELLKRYSFQEVAAEIATYAIAHGRIA